MSFILTILAVPLFYGVDGDDYPPLKTLEGHTKTVTAVSWDPQGKLIASASYDESIKLWNPATGENVATFVHTNGPHLCWIESISWEPNSRTLAAASHDGGIWLWDVATKSHTKTIAAHSAPVDYVAWSPNGAMIASCASGSDDSTVRIWDAKTGRAIHEIKRRFGYHSSLSWSRDSRTVAFGDDMLVKVWDIPSGRIQKEFQQGNDHPVFCVAYSYNNEIIASGSHCKVTLFEHKSKNVLGTLSGHSCDAIETETCILPAVINSIAWHPEQLIIASASRDSSVKIWNAVTFDNIATLAGHRDDVRSVSFSPNGKCIATGGGDKTVKVWSIPERHLTSARK
jgi:WD40 repeat protein